MFTTASSGHTYAQRKTDIHFYKFKLKINIATFLDN